MDIKFHCGLEGNFPHKWQTVRAFLYSDYSVSPHNHDFYEMNIVLGGTGIHRIGNACFDVKAGDVFVIPPMTVHAYNDTCDLDVYHILLRKEFILENHSEAAEVPGFLQLVEIEPFLRQNFTGEMFLHLSGSQLMQLKNDLSFIEEGRVFDTEPLAPLKNHTTWKILYWFSELLFLQMQKKDEKNKYDMEIVKILEFIHQNYESKITIDLLCQKSFLSRSTFLRSFQSMCRCTPMEYVNRYRCKKAVELMGNTHLSKTEIAHNCGFYDLSHMERTIKQLL